jgi:phospholipid/cholesterol/gamma-HCH transport system substrate-binding protein
MTRQTRHLKGHIATFAAVVAVAIGFVAWLLVLGGQVPWDNAGYSARALLPTAASLAPGARVTMAGVDVGTVTAVKRAGLDAVVDVKLTDNRVTPIPVDSSMQLRTHTVVGENYVSITPGSSHTMLRSGGLLPISQAGSYVDFNQILSVLQGDGRHRLRELLRGLGGAVAGRGDQLNALLNGGASALSYASNTIQIAARHTPDVSRLVDQLGRLSAAVGERDSSIQQIADSGLATLNTIASRDQAVREILRELPGALTQVRVTTDTLNNVTNTAAPIVSSLAAAVAEVRPAVQSLRPAVDAGRGVLTALSAAAPGLEGTLNRATQLAGPTPDALFQLKKTLCQANPAIAYLRPYTSDVIATIMGLGSASNSYDRFGHLIRLLPIISENSLVGLPPSVSSAALTLIHAGLLTETRGGLTYQPYSPPGQIGHETAAGQSILGPSQVPATGYRYPHVLAAC